MLGADRHQLRTPARAVIGDAEQRRVTQAQQVAATGLQQMRQTDAAGGAVEIGDVALEPDRAGLALAHAERLARRLLLKPDQRRRGRIIEPGYPVGPAHIDDIALDRRHRAHGLLRRRSEEHTSELQSLMRISSALFCLKKKKKT